MVKQPYISKESFPVFIFHFKTLFQLVRDKEIKYKLDGIVPLGHW